MTEEDWQLLQTLTKKTDCQKNGIQSRINVDSKFDASTSGLGSWRPIDVRSESEASLYVRQRPEHLAPLTYFIVDGRRHGLRRMWWHSSDAFLQRRYLVSKTSKKRASKDALPKQLHRTTEAGAGPWSWRWHCSASTTMTLSDGCRNGRRRSNRLEETKQYQQVGKLAWGSTHSKREDWWG